MLLRSAGRGWRLTCPWLGYWLEKELWVSQDALTWTMAAEEVTDRRWYIAVHVNGQEMDLEHETNLASGMNITYSNTTVSDGALWFKPGEWNLPQLTIKTPRWVAYSLPNSI